MKRMSRKPENTRAMTRMVSYMKHAQKLMNPEKNTKKQTRKG